MKFMVIHMSNKIPIHKQNRVHLYYLDIGKRGDRLTVQLMD